jgi:hypothetical protein
MENSEKRYDSPTKLTVSSTSLNTANVSSIILSQTPRTRLLFSPSLVNNPHDASSCVSGKIIYEKKHQNDSTFPYDKLSRRSIKSDESMEISLDTSETLALFRGLSNCYEIYSQIGRVNPGITQFTQLNPKLISIMQFIKSDPSLLKQLSKVAGRDLVAQLFRLVMASESIEGVRSALTVLEDKGVECVQAAINLERLAKFYQHLQSNIENANEEFWQQTFIQNQWILSQIFNSSVTIFQSKAYVGGKSINNHDGKIVDFLYKNELTNNVALIEIKTPCTQLMGHIYREGIYPPSSDLSGAVSQCLVYRDTLIKAFPNEQNFKVFFPQCVALIGKIADLTSDVIPSFELYRSSLNGVSIVTFDELLLKIKNLISILESTDQNTKELPVIPN